MSERDILGEAIDRVLPTTVERKIRGVKQISGYHGGCDAPQCHLQARWQVAFDTGVRLHMCPRHKDEVVANYEARR